MTLPDQPGGTSLDFGVLDAAFAVTSTGEIPGLADLDQPTVEAILKTQMQESGGWNAAHQAGYGGLTPGVPLTPNLLINLAGEITGLPLGTWPGTGPGGYQGEVTNILADVGNFFTNVAAMFGINVDFNDLAFDVNEAVTNFFNDMLTDPIQALVDIGNVLGLDDLLNYFSMIPIGNLANTSQNLLFNPDFKLPSSIEGQGIWTWDDNVTHLGSNSVHTVPNGILHELLSNEIRVAETDDLDLTVYTKWDSLVGTGSPIQLTLVKYRVEADNTRTNQGTEIIDSFPVSASGGFSQLNGHYTVPADVDAVRMGLVVTATATAGNVRFAKAFAGKSQLLQIPWIAGLPTELQDLIQFGADVLNSIWTGIFGAPPSGDVSHADVTDALQNIPPTNVLGTQGGTIVDTFQDIVDTLWAGFAQLFGFPSGKSIFDVASQASDTVTTARTGLELAEWNNAVAGIRNNKSILQGVDETSESNFLVSDLMVTGADPPSIAATSAAVPIVFWRAAESARKGFISWFGKGIANVTALFIDVYKLNYATNTMVLLHSSSDQIGQATANWGYLTYNMSLANRVDVVAGDVLAIAFRVTGTGTHSIAGKVATWLPDHPTVVPARPAAVRTGVGDLAFGSITYSGNMPWFGIGIAAGDVVPDYHAPRTTAFTTPGAYTYDIPEWAVYIDEIKLGGGGGGAGGDPIIFTGGAGGYAGVWDSRTLVRGVGFPVGATELTGVIGDGGVAGFAPAGAGGDGGATTRAAIASGDSARSAAGGLGSTHFDNEGFGDAYGDSPGDHTFNGTTYIGGGTAGPGVPGYGGQAPGGGGGGGLGGTWGVAGAGGPGARGSAWFVARQT